MISYWKVEAKMCPWMYRGRTMAEHWSRGSQKINIQDLWERSGSTEKEVIPDGVVTYEGHSVRSREAPFPFLSCCPQRLETGR